MISNKRTIPILAMTLAVASTIVLSGCTASSAPTVTASSSSSPATPAPTNTQNLAAELAYLVEEEKLAFDVYTVMYSTWGSQTFSNILQSEANHQSQVLAVMTAYGVSDPRSTEIGVFQNTELQKLYDTLIAQGKVSQVDAFRAGVTVEETDIADLEKMLAANPPTDVAAMMNSLLSGSQKHLVAFNRKL
jgi:hypothetical protein